ncbi:hypothetical protein B0H10DRAFT_1949643 [Mycena sp. CBHHK59/15]|nr:hypothetical protein B0H10DRAFT_1949643 [Mycena sp. CBHHK59/15]
MARFKLYLAPPAGNLRQANFPYSSDARRHVWLAAQDVRTIVDGPRSTNTIGVKHVRLRNRRNAQGLHPLIGATKVSKPAVEITADQTNNGDAPRVSITPDCEAGLMAINAADDGGDEHGSIGSFPQTTLDVMELTSIYLFSGIYSQIALLKELTQSGV